MAGSLLVTCGVMLRMCTLWYTDIGPTDIGPTDIGPTDIGPTDIGPTGHWSDKT